MESAPAAILKNKKHAYIPDVPHMQVNDLILFAHKHIQVCDTGYPDCGNRGGRRTHPQNFHGRLSQLRQSADFFFLVSESLNLVVSAVHCARESAPSRCLFWFTFQHRLRLRVNQLALGAFSCSPVATVRAVWDGCATNRKRPTQ